MEPLQISKKIFDEIQNSLFKKAFSLEKENTPFTKFISQSPIVCAYEHPPKTYNSIDNPNAMFIIHFLPKRCDLVTMKSRIEAICLCWTNDNKYYLHTHRVGRCPWKTRQK